MKVGKVFEKLAQDERVESIGFGETVAKVTLLEGWTAANGSTWGDFKTAHEARLFIESATNPNATLTKRTRSTGPREPKEPKQAKEQRLPTSIKINVREVEDNGAPVEVIFEPYIIKVMRKNGYDVGTTVSETEKAIKLLMNKTQVATVWDFACAVKSPEKLHASADRAVHSISLYA